MTADLVVRGGTVVDGTGSPGRRADVAVTDGKIVEVGEKLDGKRVVDASGQVVAPGFIDLHTHYDAQVFWDPALTPSCWHGVTTVISGNCGFSLAPCRPEHRGLMARTLEHVEGMSLEALDAGIRWEFETFPEYLDAVGREHPMLNFGAFIGHTPLRLWVMGDEGYERAATDQEISAMRAVVAEAVAAGAMGFATSSAPTHQGDGGRPVPSRKAELEEVEALAGAVGDVGKGVVQILPGEKVRLRDIYALQPRVKRPFTWTALLTVPNGQHRKAVERNRTARAEGVNVWPQMAVRPLTFMFHLAEPFTFDTVPIFAELHGVGREERLRRYADPDWRARAQDALDNGPIPARWNNLLIAETETRPELVGRTVGEVAAEGGVRPLDLMCELALTEDLRTRFKGVMANNEPEFIAELLNEDGLIIGLSDAGAHASQLCDACFSTDLLGQYVRERRAISLEGAVRKLTGELADAFGLDGRGYLRPGAAADIVVFDPDTVSPGPIHRVYDFPAGADRLLADRPIGITHVVVNGTVIREGGEPVAVDQRPGQVVRST